jgi:lipopolysaccharide/colanic/teichoic acid biosynthesis glycosyltransferase
MKSFRQFYRERDELTPLANLENPGQPNERLMRIARFALINHLDEMLSLFNKLSSQDEEIRAELEDYQKDQGKNQTDNKGDWHRDKDEIVPNSADTLGEPNL